MHRQLKEVVELSAERMAVIKKLAKDVIDIFSSSDTTLPERALCLKYLSDTFHETYQVDIEVFEVPKDVDKSKAD